MPVTARTWVEGEIATAVKFNTIRDDLLLLDSVAGIKSVQYGTITVSNGNTSNTGTITSVSTTKSVIHNLGNTADPGVAIADAMVRLALTNATTITATRGNSNGAAIVGFCVAEYK